MLNWKPAARLLPRERFSFSFLTYLWGIEIDSRPKVILSLGYCQRYFLHFRLKRRLLAQDQAVLPSALDGQTHLTRGSAFARLRVAAGSAHSAELVYRAEVAELADARGSGPRTRKGVGVRVPSSAPMIYKCNEMSRLRVALAVCGSFGLADSGRRSLLCPEIAIHRCTAMTR